MNLIKETEKFQYRLLIVMQFAIFLTTLILLNACGSKLQIPIKTESIKISVYHPWPPMDIFKTVGDWALLESGELVQIQSTKWAAVIGKTALPMPQIRIETDSAAWDKKLTGIPEPGGEPAIIDREIGVICVGSTCARTHAICPSWNEIQFGKKCSTFTIK